MGRCENAVVTLRPLEKGRRVESEMKVEEKLGGKGSEVITYQLLNSFPCGRFLTLLIIKVAR